nr:MAG TPA: hypothetical protein [Caudoviricetes sp.]
MRDELCFFLMAIVWLVVGCMKEMTGNNGF